MNRLFSTILKAGIFLCLISTGALLHAADSPAPSPKAVVPESTYTFPTVIEGESVPHDFVIQNRGNAVLNILDVKTSCGCTTASVPGPIVPGSEGTISINFNSEGRVGDIHKTIVLKTDDPQSMEITLSLEGKVDRIYTMEPTMVKLAGLVGEPLQEVVTIIPEKSYPFHITGISAKRGGNIRYRYQEIEEKGMSRIEVTVENTRKEIGPYFDTLTLATDNSHRPEIKIQVLGSIKSPAEKSVKPGSGN